MILGSQYLDMENLGYSKNDKTNKKSKRLLLKAKIREN